MSDAASPAQGAAGSHMPEAQQASSHGCLGEGQGPAGKGSWIQQPFLRGEDGLFLSFRCISLNQKAN